jgi:hypothetical protein
LQRSAVVLNADQEGHLRHGRSWPGELARPGLLRAYTRDGVLAGLVSAEDGRCLPKLSFLD